MRVSAVRRLAGLDVMRDEIKAEKNEYQKVI